jgi:glycerol kinase
MSDVVLALDCGSHAVRAIAFEVETGVSTTCATEDIPLSFPRAGWVEVDPEVVASASVRVVRTTLEWAADRGHEVLALGVANMRETAFAWQRSEPAALYPGVMWMSQQSEPVVERWREQGLDPLIRERTGLSNDAFFFGSKVAWLLEHDPQVARAAESGDLAVGTVDAWLVHRLTGGREHRTDTSNGSRYQLMSLRDLSWDAQLCDALGVPMGCLPELTPTMAHYGVTDATVCGQEIPITGVVADQQGSLLGHGCEDVGGMKATFGTSGVVSLNTGGDTSLYDGMVTSVAWTTEGGEVQYEVEGSAFHSGYTMGWLSERTGHPIDWGRPVTPTEVPAEDRVYVLPSFSVMGAPRWPRGRGAVITGLAMDTSTRDLMRAGLEAMAFQAHDLFVAMDDAAHKADEVNVDGGGAANDYLCQLLADLLERDVVRPQTTELTSVGAAKAALRGAGHEVEPYFGQDRSAAVRFRPLERNQYAKDGYERWVDLVEMILR